MGLNISPAIWQSYINAILACLQSRKYCEVIMDDLLLFIPRKPSHFDKLNRFAKGTMQEWSKDFPKEVPTFQNLTSVHGQHHFHKS